MPPHSFDNGLSRSARIGLVCILGIAIALFIFWRLLPALFPKEPKADDARLTAAWNQLKNENSTASEATSRPGAGDAAGRPERKKTTNTAVVLFLFDPNTASEGDFVRLGLSPRVARAVAHYRNKGGKFRKAADFQKIYTLSDVDYKRLAPYIRIDDAFSVRSRSGEEHDKPLPEQPLLLNTATLDELVGLRGIGPAYANRIIKFREKLGGFYEVAQLKEVYGFPDSTYQLLKDHFMIDPADIKKMNINSATLELLEQHPYIGKKMAEQIVRLRNDLKEFSKIEQLRLVPLINEEKYRKIAPYLKLN